MFKLTKKLKLPKSFSDKPVSGALQTSTSLTNAITSPVTSSVMAGSDTNGEIAMAVINTPSTIMNTPVAGQRTPYPGVNTPEAGVSTPEAGVSTPDAGVSTPDAGIDTTDATAAAARRVWAKDEQTPALRKNFSKAKPEPAQKRSKDDIVSIYSFILLICIFFSLLIDYC